MKLRINEIEPDKDNPRKNVPEKEIELLGLSMANEGQQVPVIVYKESEKYVLVDGHLRRLAAIKQGIEHLEAIVLNTKPSVARLHILQMTIEVQKVSHTAMERSNLLVKIMSENRWTVTEAAKHLHMQQPVVSRLLSYQKLTTGADATRCTADASGRP